MSKTLDITSSKDFNKSDVQFIGNTDKWKLLCKAWSKREGWMKSTKVLELKNGCLVQASTQQGDNVAESICFVPDVCFNDFE